MKTQNENNIGIIERSKSASTDTRHSPLDTSRTRRCTGKVAALPFPIRDQINQMLLDGVTYQKIADNLATLGHPGFSLQNIGRWQQSGHQQWLAERAEREDSQFCYEASLELLKTHKDPAVLCEANEITMAMQIHRALGQLYLCAPESLLTENSKIFFQLSRAVSQQLSQRTHRERLKLHAQKFSMAPESAGAQSSSYENDSTAPQSAEVTSLSHRERAGVRGKNVPELTGAPTSSKAESAAEAQAFRLSVIDKVEEVFGIKPVDSDSPDAINYGVWPPAPRNPAAQRSLENPALALDPAPTLTPHSPPSAPTPESASNQSDPTAPQSADVVSLPPFRSLALDPALTLTPHPASSAPTPEFVSNENASTAPKSADVASLSHRERAGVRGNGLHEVTSASEPANDSPTQTERVNSKSEIENPPSPIHAISRDFTANPTSGHSQLPIHNSPLPSLPVFDRFGALLDWFPRTGPNSIPAFPDPLGFDNSDGDTVCWLNPTDVSNAPPLPRAAVLNKAGEIVSWQTGPDPFSNPPSPTAIPIHSRRYNRPIAWLDESHPSHSSHLSHSQLVDSLTH